MITNIEDWTSCFSIYMAVLVQKYPFKAVELIQYLNLIRYAARYSHGFQVIQRILISQSECSNA